MASEGKATVNKFLDYTRIACEEDQNNRAADALAAAAAASRLAPGAGADDEDFYDAGSQEGDADLEYVVAGGGGATTSGAGALSTDVMSSGEAALRCLVAIRASGEEHTRLLRDLVSTMHRMDGNIAEIKAAVVPARAKARAGGDVAAAVAAAAAEANRCAPPGYSWTAMLCMGLAGASLASVVYMRARAHGRVAGGGWHMMPMWGAGPSGAGA